VTKQSNCPLANRYIRQYANAAAPQQLDQDYKTPGKFGQTTQELQRTPQSAKVSPCPKKTPIHKTLQNSM
jgi:hypothetical protein